MLRKAITLSVLTMAALIAPLMAACSTDTESTATPIVTLLEPKPNISVTAAWARPAAMIKDQSDAMPVTDMGSDPMMGMDDMDPMMAAGDKDNMPMMGMDSDSMMGDMDAMPMMGGSSPKGGSGAIYFVLTNDGDADDTLVEVVDAMIVKPGDFSDVIELHQTIMNDGVMKMERLPAGIHVPAGESVELKPGGLHVMILDIKRSLTPGDEVSLVLRFASGAEQKITVEVREP